MLRRILSWLKIIFKKLMGFSAQYVIPVLQFLNYLKELAETTETKIQKVLKEKSANKLKELEGKLKESQTKLKKLQKKLNGLPEKIEAESDNNKKKQIQDDKKKIESDIKNIDNDIKKTKSDIKDLKDKKLDEEIIKVQDEIWNEIDLKNDLSEWLDVAEEIAKKYFYAFVAAIKIVNPDLKGLTYIETVKNFITFIQPLSGVQKAMYFFKIASLMIIELAPKDSIRQHEADFLVQSYYTYNKQTNNRYF